MHLHSLSLYHFYKNMKIEVLLFERATILLCANKSCKTESAHWMFAMCQQQPGQGRDEEEETHPQSSSTDWPVVTTSLQTLHSLSVRSGTVHYLSGHPSSTRFRGQHTEDYCCQDTDWYQHSLDIGGYHELFWRMHQYQFTSSEENPVKIWTKS